LVSHDAQHVDQARDCPYKKASIDEAGADNNLISSTSITRFKNVDSTMAQSIAHVVHTLISAQMKAAVIYSPGAPDVFKIEEVTLHHRKPSV
jgi:hypothetical protein